MSRTRRAGLIVTGIASALWLVVVVGFYSTGPEDGVNLGAALLSMLAFPLSVAGAVILLVSLRGEAGNGSGFRGLAMPRRAAAVLAVVALALLATVFVVGPTDSLPPDAVVALLVSGIGAYLVTFALFLLPVDSA
jgi:peptidoglycan/LPS O-acetylase OafA/YrhL